MFEYSIYWYDDEQTILILEITGDEWDWQINFQVMQEFKDIAESVENNIYTILFFHDTPPTPQADVITNARKMMALRPKNDTITFFVGTNSLFRAILNTVSKIYILKNIFAKMQFVATVEQAIDIIKKHKSNR